MKESNNQGKRKSQMNDSETFSFIAIVLLVICIILMFLLEGCTSGSSQDVEEEKVYIHIEGAKVELVADEYGNQYLKQFISHGAIIYIPYMGPTEEPTDSLNFYQAKNK